MLALLFAEGPRDIKVFVKDAFKAKIDGIKSGLYCRAFSCEFEVETFFATETNPKTYALSTSGWLEGTISGLKGSARRAMGLTGTYIRGTCIVKDLKPVFDVTTNNNGWGASKIEAVFKHIDIPGSSCWRLKIAKRSTASSLRRLKGSDGSTRIAEPPLDIGAIHEKANAQALSFSMTLSLISKLA